MKLPVLSVTGFAALSVVASLGLFACAAPGEETDAADINEEEVAASADELQTCRPATGTNLGYVQGFETWCNAPGQRGQCAGKRFRSFGATTLVQPGFVYGVGPAAQFAPSQPWQPHCTTR